MLRYQISKRMIVFASRGADCAMLRQPAPTCGQIQLLKFQSTSEARHDNNMSWNSYGNTPSGQKEENEVRKSLS